MFWIDWLLISGWIRGGHEQIGSLWGCVSVRKPHRQSTHNPQQRPHWSHDQRPPGAAAQRVDMSWGDHNTPCSTLNITDYNPFIVPGEGISQIASFPKGVCEYPSSSNLSSSKLMPIAPKYGSSFSVSPAVLSIGFLVCVHSICSACSLTAAVILQHTVRQSRVLHNMKCTCGCNFVHS